ncbi:hypothetical protein ACFPIJ_42640 [Dactylosporangium cerinum]|uniref:Uncharacterized protein n=1 Tax=Dactylosporangium cerinum TaxID=1434730 RepID=A0ABV9W760_9ACTN
MAKGLAQKPLEARGADDVVQFAVTATGIAANAVTLLVAAGSLKLLWQAIIRSFRRQPRAEKLRIQIGDQVDINIDLEWLTAQHGEAQQAVLRSIGESLTTIADRSN